MKALVLCSSAKSHQQQLMCQYDPRHKLNTQTMTADMSYTTRDQGTGNSDLTS